MVDSVANRQQPSRLLFTDLPQGGVYGAVTMKVLENRIPPPLVAAICGCIMWLVAGEITPFGEIGVVQAAAVLIVIAVGTFSCLAGAVAFRSARTTVNPLKPASTTSLVKSGVYQISRNPMYLGFALLLFAWAIYLGSLWPVFGVMAFALFITRFQILPEERAMRSLFGREFEECSKAVRHWF